MKLYEMWRYRDLLSLLVWRELRPKYQRAWVGILWAVGQPLLSALVVNAVFAQAGFAFTFAGFIFWTFFQTSVSQMSQSFVSKQTLIKRAFFPRVTLPLASLLASGFDLLLACSVLVLVASWNSPLAWTSFLFLPLFMAWAMVGALGIGLWYSMLVAQFEDFRYLVSFSLQLIFLSSPLFYVLPATSPWVGLWYLNPLNISMHGARWCLGLQGPLSPVEWATGSIVSVALCVSGYLYYLSHEMELAEIL